MLSVRSLACRRGKRLVFRDIGFTLEAGGSLLITGRNGSGKSSLLRVLAGLLPVFEGEISWDGVGVTDWRAHRTRVGYLGHLEALKPELTVAETIEHGCALRGCCNTGGVDLLGLADLRDRPVRMLSAGQKKRLALARLALSQTALWLLDEPASALDDKGQAMLTDLIERHRAEGGLMIIATHQPEDFKGARRLSLDGDPA
jgi:heme exporter protein A